MKLNINRFLENSKRTSLIGKNIYTCEGYNKTDTWEAPTPGFATGHYNYFPKGYGSICIGHQTNAFEAVYPDFFEGGKKLEFIPVRHRWTPAWQKTYYRSIPDIEYYQSAGCISFCETKCISMKEDIFCSLIKLQSDKREKMA